MVGDDLVSGSLTMCLLGWVSEFEASAEMEIGSELHKSVVR